jgi:hypothetical protein
VKREVPPRDQVFDGRAMMMVFDVDCGELIPGHHFIARGLGGPFRASTVDRWNGDDPTDALLMAQFEEAGGYPAFTLEYELVPGVTSAEGEGNFFTSWLVSHTTRMWNSPGIPTTVVRSPSSKVVTPPMEAAATGRCLRPQTS